MADTTTIGVDEVSGDTFSIPTAEPGDVTEQPEAVIFDMDGVIVDTERYWIDVIQHVIDEVVADGEDLKPSDLMGVQVHDQYDLLVEEGYDLTVEDVAEYFDVFDTEAESIYTEKADLMPGFHDLLDDLREYDVPIAVCTSSYPDWIEMAFDRFDLRDEFDVVFSAADLDIPGKPEPDIYELVAEKVGVSPEDAVVIEDSENGVKAASRAGAYVIAYEAHAENVADLDVSAADELARGPEDLRERLLSLFET